MQKKFVIRIKQRSRLKIVIPFVSALVFACPGPSKAQEWSWKQEMVDKAGAFPAMVADAQSNLHISYINKMEGVKYAFRSADRDQWFTNVIGRAVDGYTGIALDERGNPLICYTGYEALNLVRYTSGEWKSQEVGSGFGAISFTCSVAVAADGTPHLTWYQYYDRDRSLYLHLKHASLESGAWMARTVDFDSETGKWNSLVLDDKGNPHIAYSAWRQGQAKYATWNGKHWVTSVIDSRDRNNGVGNPGIAASLVLARDGTPQVSYFDDLTLKFASHQGGNWKVDVIDTLSSVLGAGWLTSRSTLLMDHAGNPHIIYGDYLSLKHAYREGGRWRIEVIERGAPGLYKYAAAAIGPDDAIYACYQDPADDSLQFVVGNRIQTRQTTQATQKDKQ